MSERMTIAISDGIADVRFNRPDKLNGLDAAMFDAIARAGEMLRSKRGLRAVLLSGEGRAFCAGLDLGSFDDMSDLSGPLLERSHGPSNRFQHAAMLWRALPAPVIAAVHGVCLGGGLQIALGADIRIASPDARLSFMEIKWGLVPDMGAFALTRGMMREDVLRELIYSGREVSGEEARALGLITRVSANPREEGMALARQIASKSPDAVRAAKRLFAAARDEDMAGVLLSESREQAALISGANQREAMIANLEKRPAVFTD